ncbi:MAG: hypothetical protein PHI94_07480 [Eubacteriaceae bacterium]|nr:hypothetical protein [Eubacteriaceae bacterium]
MKKYQFSKARKRMGMLCILMDVIIVLISLGFIFYSAMPSALGTVLSYSWFIVMIAAFLVAVVAVIITKEYDVIRGCLFETLILVIEGIWFGVTRNQMLTDSPDATFSGVFIAGTLCIVLLTIFIHIDMIWNEPIKRFMLKGASAQTLELNRTLMGEESLNQPVRRTLQNEGNHNGEGMQRGTRSGQSNTVRQPGRRQPARRPETRTGSPAAGRTPQSGNRTSQGQPRTAAQGNRRPAVQPAKRQQQTGQRTVSGSSRNTGGTRPAQPSASRTTQRPIQNRGNAKSQESLFVRSGQTTYKSTEHE